MLVLTRKVGEQVNIGDDIVVTIIEVSKGSVRLGIKAPKDVAIHRHEVYEKIQDENLMSSKGISDDIENAARILREKGLKE